MQDTDCRDRASPYDTSSSRSLITIGQSSGLPTECVHASPDGTREMFYRNQACTGHRVPTEEYQLERPLEFQAKCIVILIEESSRKDLLEMLISAGRVLHHPLRLSFNYTTALSSNPDLAVSSMNCAVGNLILENYNRDAVGQQLESELLSLNSQLETKNKQVELFDRTVRGLLPPVSAEVGARLKQLRSEAHSLQMNVVAKRGEIGGPCVSSSTNTCGRSNAAAPDPWLNANGERCSGYETREALEGSFCAHWGSPVRYDPTNILCFSNVSDLSSVWFFRTTSRPLKTPRRKSC